VGVADGLGASMGEYIEIAGGSRNSGRTAVGAAKGALV
jgi:hypothetical protein